MKKLLGLGLAGLLGFAAQAAAQATAQDNGNAITGVTVSASSQLVGGGFNRAASNLVSGAGSVSGTSSPFSTAPDGNMWLSTGNGSSFGPADNAPSITFDLGAVYDLTGEEVWNYNEGSNGNGVDYTLRGVNTATVSTSTDGVTWSSMGPISFAKAPGNNSDDFGQIMTAEFTAEFITLSNLTSFIGGDNGYVGLSQAQFSGILHTDSIGVPEPSTIAILGLASFMVIAYRRRSWM